MTARRLPLYACAFLLSFGLGACVSTPLYKPQANSGSAGYSEQQLDQNQYRVTFTGTRSTSRDRVEDGLMLRAAEVTKSSGFSHFLVDDRQVSRDGDDWRDPWRVGPRFSFGYGYGYGRYGLYDPFAYRFGYLDRFDDSRFVASADIAMLTAAEAAREPRATDAGQVIANLSPKFAPPTP